LFADNPIGVPELPQDLSSDEEDMQYIPQNFRSPARSGSPISPCSAPETVRQNTSMSSTFPPYRLRSVSDATFGDSYSRSSSSKTFNYESSHPYRQQGYNPYSRESQYRYHPDNPPWHRNHDQHSFHDNDGDDAIAQQYLMTPVLSSSSSAISQDMSAKARGKQKQTDVSDLPRVPSRQMSQLRLETDHHSRYTGRANSAIDRYREPDFSPVSPRDGHGSRAYREDKSVKGQATPSVHSPLNRESGNTRPPPPGSKRMVNSDTEDDREWDPADDGGGDSSAKKRRKINRYPCPVPNCKETFTRRNDVRRHVRNAAVHRDQPDALAILGEVAGDISTRCKYCGTDLSRSDARMRHERASACGKRTTQKMKESIASRT